MLCLRQRAERSHRSTLSRQDAFSQVNVNRAIPPQADNNRSTKIDQTNTRRGSIVDPWSTSSLTRSIGVLCLASAMPIRGIFISTAKGRSAVLERKCPQATKPWNRSGLAFPPQRVNPTLARAISLKTNQPQNQEARSKFDETWLRQSYAS